MSWVRDERGNLVRGTRPSLRTIREEIDRFSVFRWENPWEDRGWRVGGEGGSREPELDRIAFEEDERGARLLGEAVEAIVRLRQHVEARHAFRTVIALRPSWAGGGAERVFAFPSAAADVERRRRESRIHERCATEGHEWLEMPGHDLCTQCGSRRVSL